MTGRMLSERLGQDQLLDDVHRVQPRVLPDAHPRVPRACRAASTRTTPGSGGTASTCSSTHRLVRLRVRHPAHARELRLEPTPRRSRAAPTRGTPTRWSGSTTSPPPEYNFAPIPVVASRHPLWDQDPLPVATSGDDPATRALGVEGALEQETPRDRAASTRRTRRTRWRSRERPTCRSSLAVGVAVFFVGLLVEAAAGRRGRRGRSAAVGLLRWTWRTAEDLHERHRRARARVRDVSVAPPARSQRLRPRRGGAWSC